jgi:hypothetical protein
MLRTDLGEIDVVMFRYTLRRNTLQTNGTDALRAAQYGAS